MANKQAETKIAATLRNTENLHANKQNALGNQARCTPATEPNGGPTHGQHAMNQQMALAHQHQMDALHPQQEMGGHHQRSKWVGQHHPKMQGGGNRPPPPKGQPQGKKKPDRPDVDGTAGGIARTARDSRVGEPTLAGVVERWNCVLAARSRTRERFCQPNL